MDDNGKRRTLVKRGGEQVSSGGTTFMSSSEASEDSKEAGSSGDESVQPPSVLPSPKPNPIPSLDNGAGQRLKSQLAELRQRLVGLTDPERKRQLRDELFRQVDEERHKRNEEIQRLMRQTRQMVEEQQHRHKESRALEQEWESKLRKQEVSWAEDLKKLYDEVMFLRTAAAVRSAQATSLVSAEAATVAAVEAKQLETELLGGPGEADVSPRHARKDDAGGEIPYGNLWPARGKENAGPRSHLDQQLQVFKNAVARLSPECREHVKCVRERMQQQRKPQAQSEVNDAPQIGCISQQTPDGRTEYII